MLAGIPSSLRSLVNIFGSTLSKAHEIPRKMQAPNSLRAKPVHISVVRIARLSAQNFALRNRNC